MTAFTQFVFVDFENVPKINLDLISEKPQVHVTLLIGRNQKKLDTLLSVQMHRLAVQVTPIEVGSSGRNALDITLACYLGREIQRTQGAEFFVVSKDKDYDATIEHLKAKGVRVSRYESFDSLPIHTPPKKSVRFRPPFAVIKLLEGAKAVASPAAVSPVKATVPATRKAVLDKYPKLLEQIATGKNRPGTRAKLMHHIHTAYGQKSTAEQQNAVVDRLVDDGVISINAVGKVAYL